jgi:hypothetical protein
MEYIMAKGTAQKLVDALKDAANKETGKTSKLQSLAKEPAPVTFPKLSDKPYVRLILIDKNKTVKTVQSGAFQALKIALDNGFNITCDKDGYTHLVRWAYRHFDDKKENYVREYKLAGWYKTVLLPAYEMVSDKDWKAYQPKENSFTLIFPHKDK